jgi:hypothetical protein
MRLFARHYAHLASADGDRAASRTPRRCNAYPAPLVDQSKWLLFAIDQTDYVRLIRRDAANAEYRLSEDVVFERASRHADASRVISTGQVVRVSPPLLRRHHGLRVRLQTVGTDVVVDAGLAAVEKADALQPLEVDRDQEDAITSPSHRRGNLWGLRDADVRLGAVLCAF